MTAPSERTRVKRLPERGAYDEETIHRVLDDALICHVAFVTEDGPVVIPTIHARVGRILYLHGSHTSRMLRAAPDDDFCIAATIVDGIVAARSTFHHSLNYRSVVVFGKPRVVTDPDERLVAFEAITEHVLPGRWGEARRPNRKEDAGTRLLAIEINEASVKVRTGPPDDDDADLGSGTWAGVIPLAIKPGIPESAPDLEDHVEVSASVRNYADRW